MARGLGKNAAIKLRLERENYEALIDRHGQWVHWMQGDKCSCVLNTGNPDPQCSVCKGDGWKYSFQREKEQFDVRAPIINDWICELPCDRGEATEVT